MPSPEWDTLAGNAAPSIAYQPGYNLNPTGAPYDRRNFDLDDPGTCDLSVDSLGQLSGAGNYFSASNPDKEGHQQFVADAEGFPFVQTEYTPDPTGRIRRRGGLGPQFQLGSGHEQLFFYSVPSQDELDRIFGNDVGYAAHYKKEVMVDGNRQATISYKDLKGQVIATALAGQKPANLDPIEAHVTQPIVIHLLEEENRRDPTTSSLISSRSIYLSQSSEVVFEYDLQPERFEDEPCPLSEGLCYDCMYDLSILVRDDCGEVLWDHTQQIGDLESLRSCESAVYQVDSTLILSQGNYFVTKRLTVNEEAVETYVEDYLADECVLEIRRRLIDDREGRIDPSLCEAVCEPCEYALEGAKDYRLTRSVLGGLFATSNVTIPAEVRVPKAGGCVAVCPDDRSPCKVAYQRLLADMSPGGQYAYYVDSTRITSDSPLGEVNPSRFPLSILNGSNRLPIEDISWRTPHTDYRSANGSLAEIEITEENESIAIPGNIFSRGESRYVWPQHLADVEDFIRYWEPSWAESLVVFHPEYFYYQWCIEQEASYRYDDDMLLTETYSDAVADYPSLTNSDPTDDFVGDPFFNNFPSAIPEMLDSLTNFMVHPDLSRPLTIGETVTIAHHCNHPRMTVRDMEGCLRGKAVYDFPSTQDKEWGMYRAMYTSRKREVMDREIERYMSTNRYFSNRIIGRRISWSHLNYREKTKRFPSINDIRNFLPDDTGYDFTNDWWVWLDFQQRQTRNSCGHCPAADDFEALLNAMAQESLLTNEIQLPGAPPLSLSAALADAFGGSGLSEYRWMPTYYDDYHLEVSITVDGVENCKVTMYKDGDEISWTDIAFFSCMEMETDGFRIKGYNQDHEMVEVYVESPCLMMNFAQCSDAEPVCRTTPEAEELGVFFDYLFAQNFHTAANVRVHTAGFESPHFGPSLRARHAGASEWDWQFRGWLVPDRSFEGELAILIRDGRLVPFYTERCRFTFSVKTPGARISEIVSLIDILPGGSNDDFSCEQHGFVLIAERADGSIMEIEGTSQCYAISNCCTAPPEESCCLPITPKVPWEPTCLLDAFDLAGSNAERVFQWRLEWLADSVRTAYIDRCLSAAETFDMSYDEDTYHYTLFYHDQAGNLVKTVPPKGVRLLNEGQIQQVREYRAGSRSTKRLPGHRYITTYQHNTLNELIAKETPDGGITRYCYDELGRIILSQDAVQAEEGSVTYLLYDALGRMVESGKTTALTTPIPTQLRYRDEFTDRWMSGPKTEIVKTYYDFPTQARVSGYFTTGQNELRNRIATITFQEEGGAPYDHATHYSYDAVGNIKELVQEFAKLAREYPALEAQGQHLKSVKYDYDLISGNVNRITYQPGDPDQFIHWYRYDADNRLVDVRTSRWEFEDLATMDLDAHYEYYAHGPEARIALGSEKVQGIDFAYTIQGWLKAMNSETLAATRDIGRDAATGGNELVAKDVLGVSLEYFGGDYQSIDEASLTSSSHPLAEVAGSALVGNGFYNGLIKHEVNALGAFEDPLQAKTYRYDQLGRLRQMRIFKDLTTDLFDRNTWLSGRWVNEYQTDINYDANGNISRLNRRDQDGNYMDRLSYRYVSRKNQLRQITDRVSTPYQLDLENQSSSSNYQYDEKGRLIADDAEDIGTIDWTLTDKVKRILKTDDCCPDMDRGEMMSFEYNASGHRVWKETTQSTIFYVRDNSGNILSTYAIEDDTVVWQYVPIYGDDRIGIYQPDTTLNAIDSLSAQRGQKHYELVNHVGSVMTTVSDRKLPNDSISFKPDVTSAQDYYPFGMLMPEKHPDTLAFSAPPMGFQGMENDHDIKGEGNSQTTEYRLYDGRVGRWASVDPAMAHDSPYQGMGNNPIQYTDPKGDTVISQVDYRNTLWEVDQEVRESDVYRRAERLVAQQDELVPLRRSSGGPGNRGTMARTPMVTRRSMLPAEQRVTERDLERLYIALSNQELERRIGPMRDVEFRPMTWDELRAEAGPTIGPANPNATTVPPHVQFRNELDVVTSSPFAGLIFVFALNRGSTRAEALDYARLDNHAWDLAGGVRGFHPRTTSQARRSSGGRDRITGDQPFRFVQPMRGSDITVPPPIVRTRTESRTTRRARERRQQSDHARRLRDTRRR
ncbi:MAG: RHS repeat-associated core domain-containing protein [Bacteroidota bacterium]